MAAFSKDVVIHVIDDCGDVAELMAIHIGFRVYDPRYGHFISFGEEDNYLFIYSEGTLCLISLENKRVEFDGSEVCYISEV